MVVLTSNKLLGYGNELKAIFEGKDGRVNTIIFPDNPANNSIYNRIIRQLSDVNYQFLSVELLKTILLSDDYDQKKDPRFLIEGQENLDIIRKVKHIRIVNHYLNRAETFKNNCRDCFLFNIIRYLFETLIIAPLQKIKDQFDDDLSEKLSFMEKRKSLFFSNGSLPFKNINLA
jgi:hypothetical protein